VGSSLEISAQVTVAADAERVWQTALDWSRQSEWIWGTRVTGGHGVGAEVTGWTGVGPVGFTDTMVITQWDPPRRCVVRHTGRLVRGVGVFEVRGDGPPCQFRWAEELDLPFPAAVGALLGPLIRPVAEWSLRASLRRFARLL
jgi:Polyketide cyclase / dehydrase and lipid transport